LAEVVLFKLSLVPYPAIIPSMVAQISPAVNGSTEHAPTNANGKTIRSKNQLRRLKQKQKKAETPTAVRTLLIKSSAVLNSCLVRMALTRM
jgi:hypothetical protein